MRRVPSALDYYRCSFGRFRNERADELLKSSAEELFQLGFQGLGNLEERKRKGRKCTQKPNDRFGFGGLCGSFTKPRARSPRSVATRGFHD